MTENEIGKVVVDAGSILLIEPKTTVRQFYCRTYKIVAVLL